MLIKEATGRRRPRGPCAMPWPGVEEAAWPSASTPSPPLPSRPGARAMSRNGMALEPNKQHDAIGAGLELRRGEVGIAG
jgi:hypothetical protein